MHDSDSRWTAREPTAPLWSAIAVAIALTAVGAALFLRRDPLRLLFDAEHNAGVRLTLGRLNGERYGAMAAARTRGGAAPAVSLAVGAAAANTLLRFSGEGDAGSLRAVAVVHLANSDADAAIANLLRALKKESSSAL